ACAPRGGIRGHRRASPVRPADRATQARELRGVDAPRRRDHGAHRPAGAVRIAGHARGRALANIDLRVLVTGATGFTGGQLARALKARGYDVWAMLRTPAGAESLQRDGIQTRTGDLASPASLPAAVSGMDVVYNIAALYRQAGLPDSVYHQVNGTAVGQLIEAAAGAGVRRVVHCSTVGVHGDIEHPPAGEDAPL